MKRQTNPIEMTRRELHEAVWSKPRSQLAKQWGCTATDISQACQAADIYPPPVGYWTRVQHGKGGMTPVLLGEPEALATIFPSPIAVKKAKEAESPLPDVPVTASIEECLPLIQKAYRAYSAKSAPTHYQYQYLMPDRKQLVRMYVMPETVTRACLLMDSLLRACNARKWTVMLPDDWAGHNQVVVDGEIIPFTLRESRTQSKVRRDERWESYDIIYHATGKLRWQFGGSFLGEQQSDSKRGKLEDKLPQLLVAFEDDARKQKQQRAEREADDRQCRLRDRLWSLVNALDEENQACITRLTELADAHQQAEKIRALVSHCRHSWETNGTPSRERQWLDFAAKHANHLDPATRKDTLNLATPVDVHYAIQKRIAENPEDYGDFRELNLDTEIPRAIEWGRKGHHRYTW